MSEKLNKTTFKRIEYYLENIDGLRKEIEELKEMADSEFHKPVERGYLISAGIPIAPRNKTDEDINLIETILRTREMNGYEYEVPCHHHVANASVCAVYGFHMSRCPLVKGTTYGCSAYDGGVPTKSIYEERASQFLNYNYPEIIAELADYLDLGEEPPFSLMKVLLNLKRDFETNDSKGYLNVLFGKNKPKTKSQRNRRNFSTGERFEVLKKSNFSCVYCGRRAEDGIKLHIDHIVPLSKDGTNDLDNLAAACEECNLGKSDNLIQQRRE